MKSKNCAKAWGLGKEADSSGEQGGWDSAECLLLSPGGRGQDGSPVITFPDYPTFSEVPDKEFQNVMTYLTSIPRCVLRAGHWMLWEISPAPRPQWVAGCGHPIADDNL